MCVRSSRCKPDTGELKWHYQMVPGDSWDFDSVQQLMLADLNINGRAAQSDHAGQQERLLLRDRPRHRASSFPAQPFSKVTWAKGIDQKTGRPIVNPEAHYGADPITISPGGGGAHNWSPMSFNPSHGPGVYSHFDREQLHLRGRTEHSIRSPVRLRAPCVRRPPPTRPTAARDRPGAGRGTASRGALVAWDPVAQHMRWRTPGGGGIGGGTVTTAGNLVFRRLTMAGCWRTAPTKAKSCWRSRPACAAAWARRSPISSMASSMFR